MEGFSEVRRCITRFIVTFRRLYRTSYQWCKTWLFRLTIVSIFLGFNLLQTDAAPFVIAVDYTAQAQISWQHTLERQRAQKIFKIRNENIWLLYVIESKAREYDVPVSIAYALAAVESNYNPSGFNRNKNNTIDEGLFQLNSANRKFFTKTFWKKDYDYNPYNPDHSAQIGLAYLRYLYNHFQAWDRAIAAYNCGINRVTRNTIPVSTKTYVQLIMMYSYIIEKGKAPIAFPYRKEQ